MNSRYEVRIELIKMYPLKAYQLMSQTLTKTFGFNPKQNSSHKGIKVLLSEIFSVFDESKNLPAQSLFSTH